MPAKSSKTPAKKTTPKKTTAKKPPAKKSSASGGGEPKDLGGLVEKIVEGIKSGQFDGFVTDIDDAVTARINAQRVKKSPAKSTSDDKKVSPAPKRNGKKSEPLVLEPNKTYKIAKKVKKLSDAKVKFIRFKADDDNKVMVEMMVDKPGFPKGKRFVISKSALTK